MVGYTLKTTVAGEYFGKRWKFHPNWVCNGNRKHTFVKIAVLLYHALVRLIVAAKNDNFLTFAEKVPLQKINKTWWPADPLWLWSTRHFPPRKNSTSGPAPPKIDNGKMFIILGKFTKFLSFWIFLNSERMFRLLYYIKIFLFEILHKI